MTSFDVHNAAVACGPSVAVAVDRRRLLGMLAAMLPMAVAMMYLSVMGANVDLGIYRGALTEMLHGNSVYSYSIWAADLKTSMGFVYTPFASLLMLPLALGPAPFSKIMLGLVTTALVMLALAGCFSVVDTRRAVVGHKPVSLIVWAWVATLVGISIPSYSNMQLGQVSLIVVALVLIDVTLLPPRWRGVLVGLTGAIKLTPMILVPYYLVTKQWRAAVNSCAAFGVAAVIGAILRWPDSVRYWLVRDVIGNSMGVIATWDNWSIYATLSRLGLSGSVLQLSWITCAVVVLAVALWRSRKVFSRGQAMEAVLIMGIAGGLANTLTWSHHMLFLVVAGVLLAVRRPVIGISALLVVTVGGYMVHTVIGFFYVALMLALVVFGFPADSKVTNPLLAVEEDVS